MPAVGPGQTRFTDKRLENFEFVGLINAILPNATFIHVRRDPRDSPPRGRLVHRKRRERTRERRAPGVLGRAERLGRNRPGDAGRGVAPEPRSRGARVRTLVPPPRIAGHARAPGLAVIETAGGDGGLLPGLLEWASRSAAPADG